MKLSAGEWTMELRPEAGGAITALRRRGIDILRSTAEEASDPFAFAHFALVPYANRIADGRFAFDGRAVRLAPNHPRQAHPLHGVGWLVPWQVAASGPASVTLLHTHDGNAAWPWRYEAVQRISLDAAGLTATLTVSNRDDRAMPVSLGFHPYFARSGVRSLAFGAEGVWLADAAMLPTVMAPADALGDWSQGAALERSDLVDHCYTGWNGTVRIGREDGDVVVRGSGTRLLHLYVPPGEDHFCVEPVTAMPDAINRGVGEVLAPAEARTIAMTIGNAPA
ncbi:aldose 1-epimerase [Sphingomonas sp. KR1UV-12]|uniref:Aldose 1-epimerase n=1 Tax=Sphingomonas aurea TaxID=3063994 RepID=A0ABT9EIF7_9SPHN|nr:aldose 1-epimerase [Sphingomonas sp. KR1UV-12]MDP1026736.1 aldose 1-epimerase [Sphingomonas sp. KR1UV-12]